MDILGEDAPDLPAWRVRTNLAPTTLGDPTPALFRPAATARSSLVCCDTVVGGAVEHSILSPGVVVERGAVVRDSVILHRCRIAEGAVVDRAILDKDVLVGPGALIGSGDAVPNHAHPRTLTTGTTVIGKGTRIPARLRIGRSCIVYPDMREADFSRPEIPSGTVVGA
jgi:glucose-1-phosphate adenylyltransferase